MKRKLRIFISWVIISLVFQFGIYAFLDNRIAKVLAPPANEPITMSLTARIPGSNLGNPQLSYDKKYLAYMDNGVFKVFNLKTEKQVFSKGAAPGSSQGMGVISYKWLPDRNTLIYFYARKNTASTNPTTKTPAQTNSASAKNAASNNNSTRAGNSGAQPGSGTSNNSGTLNNSVPSNSTTPAVKTQGVQIGTKTRTDDSAVAASTGSSASTGSLASTDSTSDKNPAANTEDPAQSTVPAKPDPESAKPSAAAPSQTPSVKPYNPQITELYTLEFLDEDGMEPEDRRNDVESLDSYFPAGGQIVHMDFSTSTNLIYLTVKSGSTMKLLEIDVMKDSRNLTKNGETITNLAVSDQYGTLYINSKQASAKQVVAVKGWQRYALSNQDNQYLLGAGNGKVYLGEVKNDTLVKILTATDSLNPNNIKASIETYWEGSIPYKNSKTVIGAQGQVIIYDQATAYVISDGKTKTLELTVEKGRTSFITADGAELFQLLPEGNSTVIELKPLDQ